MKNISSTTNLNSESSFKNTTTSSKRQLNLDSVAESSSSGIKLLSVVSDKNPPYIPRHPRVKDYGESHHYRNVKRPQQKPKNMLSLIKSLGKGAGYGATEQSAPEYHHPPAAAAYPVEESNGWGGGGWGSDNHHHYHQKHVYTVKGSGGHSMYFSFLDLVLTGLSLISFGAFLLNLLMNLLSVSEYNNHACS